MVSEKSTKISPCDEKHTLPRLPEPKTVRIKLRKCGSMQFISLLDLQRTVQKIFIRAGIPMWYTQGFNPHPKIIFAAPLPVGTQSECEYIDVRLDREISCEKILERINAQMTDEFCALEVYEPTTKLNEIAFSEYDYELFPSRCEGAAEKIASLFASPSIMMTKRTKSGDKEFDMIPLIRSFEVSAGDNSVKIKACLSVEAESYLNPELVVSAIKEKTDVFACDAGLEVYTVIRRRLFFSDGVTEYR